MAFVQTAALPRTGLAHGSTAICTRPARTTPIVYAPAEIQAAKHAQFKAAKKANRYRPKKHRPSDINRKPPPFNPEPLRAEGLPPVMTIMRQGTAEYEEASKLTPAAVEAPVVGEPVAEAVVESAAEAPVQTSA